MQVAAKLPPSPFLIQGASMSKGDVTRTNRGDGLEFKAMGIVSVYLIKE